MTAAFLLLALALLVTLAAVAAIRTIVTDGYRARPTCPLRGSAPDIPYRPAGPRP
ncbi:hypothetical protein ACIQLK_01545 [Microbacterium sp. NPDC091382]|uniref:hypothetical protein n=1 Tax=Microbacterium sp. NPDC091382 TaxID=3364210 RepID=UPI00382B59F6